MKTIITTLFTLLFLLTSCGSSSNNVNQNLNPNSGHESGVMIEDSSTIILDDNTDTIEWWAEWTIESGEEISL